MKCSKCGFENNNGSRFCGNCGNDFQEQVFGVNNNTTQIVNQSNIQQPNTNYMQNQNFNYNNMNNSTNKKSKLALASLILGIISLVTSFVFTLFTLPFSITGLILGIVNNNKENKKEKTGIILNVLAIIVAIVVLILGAIFLDEDDHIKNKNDSQNNNQIVEKNEIEGKYDCTAVDGDHDKYLITLHLNHDNSFLYGPYGELENNYVKGNYQYEDEHKTNNSGEYKYYMVTLNGNKEDYVVDGEKQDHDFISEMEFGIATKDGKRNGVIMFVSSYNMYYCYEN